MAVSPTHKPVLLKEVLDALSPRDGGIYVDGTFGRGGYSRAILEAAECRVIAIDRDPEAIAAGQDLIDSYSGRLDLIEGSFGDMQSLLAANGVVLVDGIALDLGVSSPQLDDAGRGFSFREDGPLDMRMAKSGRTAAEVVNALPEKELADVIWRYGEERRARQVARAIVAAREEQPIERTLALAEVVRKAVGKGKDKIDPATRTFQGLRIFVNDELGELERALEAAEKLLKPGGRLVVVSFHSLEDRIVKDFLRARSDAAPRGSRHLPAATPPAPAFTLLKRGAVKPGDAEMNENPRARSARLRAAERTAAQGEGGAS
jgi:16S rRNA (cytosine1402-N4)-methyltransferase